MQARRVSRERLLQALYQHRVTGDWSEAIPLRLELPEVGDDVSAPPVDEAFIAQIVDVLDTRREEIDGLIDEASRNWRLDRMAAVDLSLLRLATAELLAEAAPARVVINEAVELAKGFGADGSATFVNGVLDGVLRAMKARS